MSNESPTERVAAQVRSAIANKGIRQAAVGAALGMSQAAVSRRLSGEVPFKAHELLVLGDELGIDTRDLLPATAATP